MNKKLTKSICKILFNIIDNINAGYEMDCLISEEFTPSPDYSDLIQQAKDLCIKYNVSYKQFFNDLTLLSEKNKHPFDAGMYYIMKCELIHSEYDIDNKNRINKFLTK